MKRDNVNYLLVGAFVAVMFVAGFILLVAVTGRSGPTDEYLVFYDNVSGLKFGTGVYYEGYRAGQIENITPESSDREMRYRIELSVSEGWKIPSDSIASVESSGLISAVTIQINEGDETTFLQPGDTINGREQSDLFSVINQAAGDFRTLSQEGILPLVKNLNERITQVATEIVSFKRDDLSPFVHMMHRRLDEDLISETVQLIEHLDQSARNLQTLLGDVNQQRVVNFLAHIDVVALNLNGLINRIEETRLQMNEVLSSVNDLVAHSDDKISGAVTAAEDSMEELELALKTVNQHLSQILINTESGSRHMNEFTRSIRENPSRLLRKSSATEPGPQ